MGETSLYWIPQHVAFEVFAHICDNFQNLVCWPIYCKYSKICLKQPFKKKTNIGFQDRLLLNAGQKYCRMLHREHSAIRSTFIKLPFVIKILVLSIFE